MARELRQATAVTSVLNPDGPSYSNSATTSVTFAADFDGDGCINGVAPNPMPQPPVVCQAALPGEPGDPHLLLGPGRDGPPALPDPRDAGRDELPGQRRPADPRRPGHDVQAQLSQQPLSLRRNSDGITTWRELDAAGAPVGNDNDQLDEPDLGNVDSVVIELVVSANGAHAQSYTTQVDLRNLS